MPAMSSGDVSTRDEYDGVALRRHLDRALRGERDAAAGGPGSGGKALREQPAGLDRGLLLGEREERSEKLDELLGLDPQDRFVLVDQALVDHLGRDPHRGETGSLGVARLEDIELVFPRW